MPEIAQGPITTRRTALARIAAAGAVTVPAVTIAASPIDLHPAWYAEWEANLDWCNAPGSTGGRDLDEVPQWQRVEELEELIGTTPAATLTGAAAQLKVLAYCRSQGLVPDDALDAGLESALAVVERSAGEAAHA
jgi:hypothetical protein